MKCRSCQSHVDFELIDLGSAPLSNAYLTAVTLRRPEKWFPLRVLVCESCWLVQAEAYSRAAEIFNDEYAYFSSFSDAWMDHARRYFDEIVDRFDIGDQSFVVEVASNDGYLLQHFVEARIPCLGVEPTASTAMAARSRGVPTLERFFDEQLAQEIVETHGRADIWVGNNVLAHVPDPIGFLRGVNHCLKDTGVATFEFPHLMNLIKMKQFDTIYHEHFAYLSFSTVVRMLSETGLEAFDVQKLTTHGGSLRVFAARVGSRIVGSRVGELLREEQEANMFSRDFYTGFARHAEDVKNQFLSFLLARKCEGKSVVGYGAAAKGNTLLNFAGVKPDLLEFVVDRNPAKQGKYLPGSRIPIVGEEVLKSRRPDYVVVLPWNLAEEIEEQLQYARGWNCSFVTAVPHLIVR